MTKWLKALILVLVALIAGTGHAVAKPIQYGHYGSAYVYVVAIAPTQGINESAQHRGPPDFARVADWDQPVSISRVDVAANTVDDLGRVLSHADLNPAQLSNFTRYTKKLQAGAEPTVITRGADGAVQLSTKVPGRAPGSYATYDKVVDASGTTIGYTKTTVAPDGTIVHIKDKLLP